MTAEQPKPQVKRVRPYPMDATLQIEGKPAPIAILFISARGFIARTPGHILKVGQNFELTVELPVLHHWVRTPGRVVKTYDRATDVNASSVERLVEFLFTELPREHQKQIERFTKAIGQKNT